MEWDLIYLPIKNNNPERFLEIKIFEEKKTESENKINYFICKCRLMVKNFRKII